MIPVRGRAKAILRCMGEELRRGPQKDVCAFYEFNVQTWQISIQIEAVDRTARTVVA